ncbi:hypothetical protein MMC13_008295 [Lambiella insularis]|nr:hypothetical protein [Lambiella insularis]
MGDTQSLEGACSCGRNQYLIVLPQDADSTITIYFDDSSDNRRAHSSPLPAFLRVPLPLLQSTTYAFYPNETHSDIRRVFTPWHAPHIKRYFCGFCGTPLTSWNEETSEEAEMVSVNLASLRSDSLDILADAGLLPSARSERESVTKQTSGPVVHEESRSQTHGQPWFGEIIQGSESGKMRRWRGEEVSADGKSRVEWEIMEFDGDDSGESVESGIGIGKRKLSDLARGEDVLMRSV